jgi:hypothetical protein
MRRLRIGSFEIEAGVEPDEADSAAQTQDERREVV